MYAIGHMALAYLLAKPIATKLKVNINIPTALLLSIIPDIDILAGEGFHRGPTHSIIVATLIFIPLLYIYRKQAVPYFLALISHSLIGDLLIGGKIQLLWPIYNKPICLPPPIPTISITSTTNVILELILFTAATVLMLKTKDLQNLLQPHKTNLLLAIPVATVLLPTILGYPLKVATALIPPHIFYLIIFTASILIAIFPKLRKH